MIPVYFYRLKWRKTSHYAYQTYDFLALERIVENNQDLDFTIEIKKQNSYEILTVLNSPEDLEDWRITLERSAVWKKDEMTAINPKHYKEYLAGFEWLDAMSRIKRFENPDIFKGALELQIRKYLDRNGQKDSELQETKKARFYLQYLIMYIENGDKPIFAKDVHASLGE
jgi:hypothetical protein